MNRSAVKRDRQSKERRLRNRETKSTFRTAIKKFDAAVAANDKATAEEAMKLSFKWILLQTKASSTTIQLTERSPE